MTSNSTGYACPHCRQRELNCQITVPFIRGFLLAYQTGTKRFLGCVSCVRMQLLKEAGLSALIGWFSISAVIVNPLFITYGILRATFLWANPDAVNKTLREAGLPSPA
jgi:hypothetical protein